MTQIPRGRTYDLSESNGKLHKRRAKGNNPERRECPEKLLIASVVGVYTQQDQPCDARAMRHSKVEGMLIRAE
jgi:hypothetical protein